jgi:hypothetical protein
MFTLEAGLKVYVHRDAVDFRKGINGLAAIAEQSMNVSVRRRNGRYQGRRDARMPFSESRPEAAYGRTRKLVVCE